MKRKGKGKKNVRLLSNKRPVRAGRKSATGDKQVSKKTVSNKKKDADLASLNDMLLKVLRQKAKRRSAKKKALKETGLWDEFEMTDDELDAEDDY